MRPAMPCRAPRKFIPSALPGRRMANVDILEDACAALPHTTRAMFGGHGLFAPNGGMFAAVVDDDRIALKLPEAADAEAFRAMGGEPWVYDGKMTMNGWLVVPDDLYDDPRGLAEWARRAHATAKPGKKKAAKGAKKAPGAKGAAKKAPAKGAATRKAPPAKAPAKKAPAKKPARKRPR